MQRIYVQYHNVRALREERRAARYLYAALFLAACVFAWGLWPSTAPPERSIAHGGLYICQTDWECDTVFGYGAEDYAQD